MRYLTADFIYVIHSTLRRAYSRLGQGRTFNPPHSVDETYARLEGAVSRPRMEYGGIVAYPTLFEKVAALGHGIAQGHVFGNGNKRTALSAMVYALDVNGWHFQMPPQMASLMMLRIGSLGCSRHPGSRPNRIALD
jgi:death-on-curing family protein